MALVGTSARHSTERYTEKVNVELSQVAVVIPALNEAESIPLVLGDMPAVGWVFVVDNGSTDTTAAVAQHLGATVLSQPKPGYGNACQTGIKAAVDNDAKVVVILDGDHSFDPMEIEKLVRPIFLGEADMVLGDRTQTAETGALVPQQRFGNWVATSLIRSMTGHRYADMGPFRAIRTRSLIAMKMEDPNFGWNVEMQLKALRHQMKIVEIPVKCRNRAAGESKISGSVRAGIRCGLMMMMATWRYSK
jgi:glycosyltransferase involved in cell wall biosynthesis